MSETIHRAAMMGDAEPVRRFLDAVKAGDAARATEAVRAHPEMESASLHVAAVLGREGAVRRIVAEDASAVRSRAGDPPSEPLLWLGYSPFHGESTERDEGLTACARALLDAGADPNTRDPEHGVPVLYAVTGHHDAPRIARVLLEAGAEPTDGESVFHAAERFHEEALELLLRFGADLNHTGEWGNTPLYFLLDHWDVEREESVRRGLLWLLAHGADPNVRSGREQESALQIAVRRGQSRRSVRLLLDHGADVEARRGDSLTAWALAERGGFDDLKTVLEEAGATPQPLTPGDELLAACSRGDEQKARRLVSPELLTALEPADMSLLVEAARSGRLEVVRACLAVGFPVDHRDGSGATALHGASLAGQAAIVGELLRRGAALDILDAEHQATVLDWACFGADFIAEPGGDYESCVRQLLEAGAGRTPGSELPRHEAVRALLERHSGE